MANPLLTIDVDASEVLAAFDRLGALAETYVKASAKETAEAIVREARARVARRTGVTASMLHIEETHDGKGYVVLPWDATFEGRLRDSGNNDDLVFALPRFLEFGTQTMAARPYLFVSAEIEEAAHLRRLSDALQDAIDELGLGD